jgi:endoglucanase
VGERTGRSRRVRIVALAAILMVGAGAVVVGGGAVGSETNTGSPSTSIRTSPEEDAMAATTPTPIPVPSVDASSVSTAAADSLPGWLHTDGGTIRTEDNEEYSIRAVSWFGMETSNCAPHGLWSINLDAGLAHIKSMGFNTIRLPFSNECLAASTTNSIDYTLNPALQGMAPLALMDAFIAGAKTVGLNVILDRHRPDSAAQSTLWYTAQYPEERWISDWQALATRYAAEPAVIGFDLHNEPHGQACWGCGTAAVDWQAAATRAGNAVLAINPRLLIVIEGVERQGNGTTTWWGGGLADVAGTPVELDVADRVVYSPHDYPASVYHQTWFSDSDYPNNLPGVWDTNWGYLAKNGIAPVLLGEFGTTLTTTSDQQWLATMVDYLDTTGISFGFWSFNPNSGDTGGLVHDDWTTPQAAKLNALAPLLRPTAPGTPAAPASAAPTPAVTPTSPPTVTRPVSPTPSIPGGSPTPATPTTPGTPPATVPAPAANVQAKWILQNSWGEGYVADLEITSSTGARSWSVTWRDPAAVTVANSWGARCAVSSGSITCTGADWAASIAPGQTHKIGLQVQGSAAPSSPTLSVTAN